MTNFANTYSATFTSTDIGYNSLDQKAIEKMRQDLLEKERKKRELIQKRREATIPWVEVPDNLVLLGKGTDILKKQIDKLPDKYSGYILQLGLQDNAWYAQSMAETIRSDYFYARPKCLGQWSDILVPEHKLMISY